MVKRKKCRVCGLEFKPRMTTQRVCGFQCAVEIGRKEGKKKRDKEHRERKKKFYENDRSRQLKLAQQAFNSYIRERDKGQPCISCNRSTGAKINAGHYRSVGAAPHLRFNQFNVNLQCEHCNCYKSGNAVEYRINLVKKFGVDKVEEIESTNESKRWSLEEIRSIKRYYLALTRRLKLARGGENGVDKRKR